MNIQRFLMNVSIVNISLIGFIYYAPMALADYKDFRASAISGEVQSSSQYNQPYDGIENRVINLDLVKVWEDQLSERCLGLARGCTLSIVSNLSYRRHSFQYRDYNDGDLKLYSFSIPIAVTFDSVLFGHVEFQHLLVADLQFFRV